MVDSVLQPSIPPNIIKFADGNHIVCRLIVVKNITSAKLYLHILGVAITSDAKQILANNLKRLRVSSGLSQEALAERAGLHRTYVSSVERAQRNITVENIYALAQALSCDPRELLNPIIKGE
ncbi:helix-turn-helix domain-containing protein [Desulfobacter hydrogenophilus]|uniref:helix-turn-helix domain-containing protein n=1 Tax=Desulfobacter hydrogenophilus TaxID=2291 RepID=UPI002012BF37|nr:helix-turn-helix transcriptional regulator [Desulfobacter hydrogenophilus]